MTEPQNIPIVIIKFFSVSTRHYIFGQTFFGFAPPLNSCHGHYSINEPSLIFDMHMFVVENYEVKLGQEQNLIKAINRATQQVKAKKWKKASKSLKSIRGTYFEVKLRKNTLTGSF